MGIGLPFLTPNSFEHVYCCFCTLLFHSNKQGSKQSKTQTFLLFHANIWQSEIVSTKMRFIFYQT